MNTPVEHAKSIVRTCQLLYDDIHRISKNREWGITEVQVSPLDIKGVFHVRLSADSDSQFTWSDIKQIEQVIQTYSYPIECVVMIRMDVSYGDDFDIDEYEDVLVQNSAFRNYEDTGSVSRCFGHSSGGCPMNDTELWYNGRFRLAGTDLRDIEQYASDPIAMEIMQTVSAATGCPMDNMPEVTPITPEEITKHVREIRDTLLAGRKATTINTEVGVRLTGEGSPNKKFYLRAISSTRDLEYKNFENQLPDTLRHLWNVTFPYVLSCQPATYMHLHTNDVLASRRLTQLHEEYFKHFDIVDVRLTTKPITHEFTEHSVGGGAKVILVAEDGSVIASGETDRYEDRFKDCVTRFLQDFGSCAGN